MKETIIFTAREFKAFTEALLSDPAIKLFLVMCLWLSFIDNPAKTAVVVGGIYLLAQAISYLSSLEP